MCRYIVDPQNEGVLLPTRGAEANMHQRKYKISSHVQAFLKQFAQWRSERQFESAGLLAIQRETQDFKTFGKTANSDQDLSMTR